MTRTLLTLILVSLSFPATATTDAFPALYDVVGVAEDDVLNVRSGPGTAFEIVGTLAHDAQAVEVISPNERYTWGMINHGEGTGWIAMDFIAPQPGQWHGSFPQFRQCFGTEPFWSLQRDAARIEFSMPDLGPRDGLIAGIFSSLSHRDRFAYRGSFFPSPAGNLDIAMFVRREFCGDGMSDRAYGIQIDMLLTRPDAPGDNSWTGLYSGCCSLTPPPGE